MNAAAQVEAVQVAGAGRMGQGIALAFAFAGLPVTLIDVKPRDAEAHARHAAAARDAIAAQLATLVALGRLAPERVAVVSERIAIVDRAAGGEALREGTLLFEAVPEVLDAKLEALSWAEAHLPAHAVIASTTSTFLVTELQSHVARPGRLLNAHWLNPAHLIPLVEISRSEATDVDAIELTRALLERIGKRPVLGLLEFIDWGGCDILFHASNYLSREIGPRFAPTGIVGRHMGEGRDGLRTGSGFYAYRQDDTAAYVQARIGAFGALLDHLGLAPEFDAVRAVAG
jgi:3-hydroxybutyryl-CoA dehydrogenase